MAGIDRIYGNQDQYIQLYKWCKENRSKIRKELRLDVMNGLYDHGYNEELDVVNLFFWPDPEEEKALSSFNREIDSYLWDHCDLDFVQERLKVQYSEKPIPRKRYTVKWYIDDKSSKMDEKEFDKIQEALDFVDEELSEEISGGIATRTYSNIIDFYYENEKRVWYTNRYSCFRLLFGIEEYRKMIQEMKEINND